MQHMQCIVAYDSVPPGDLLLSSIAKCETVLHLISTNRGQVLKRDLLPNIAVEVDEPTVETRYFSCSL